MAYNKEIRMWEGYIYKIYNDVNNKIYIGQTIRTIKKRWTNHKYNVRNNIGKLAIHNAMRKYGIELFHIEEIESCSFDTKEKLKKELDKKEIFYISKYNCRIPYGYNIADGGSGTSGVNCREIISCDPYTKKYFFIIQLMKLQLRIMFLHRISLHVVKKKNVLLVIKFLDIRKME